MWVYIVSIGGSSLGPIGSLLGAWRPENGGGSGPAPPPGGVGGFPGGGAGPLGPLGGSLGGLGGVWGAFCGGAPAPSK
jgi:hypothetical protein